jgi:glycine C-acetyltransferase
MIGDTAATFEFSRRLFEAGLYATGIGFPTVPQGRARVRTIVTSEHTTEQLDSAVDILSRTAREMSLVKPG